MKYERRGADDEINQAMEALRAQIDRRVRREQQVDQLTKLPNEAALLAAMDDLILKEQHFWVAFFEIDRFKWINDKFGYENADALLVAVAEVLAGSKQYFAGESSAFRAHGDEFYLLGLWGGASEENDDAALENTLRVVRSSIGAIKVQTPRGTAQCTISVGWLQTASAVKSPVGPEAALTSRRVKQELELSVAVAKWSPEDGVVRFDPKMKADEAVTLRSACTGCQCKFQVSLKRSALGEAMAWACPNCGKKQERPPVPPLLTPSTAPEAPAV